jgi:hypothetical protein
MGLELVAARSSDVTKALLVKRSTVVLSITPATAAVAAGKAAEQAEQLAAILSMLVLTQSI